MYIYRYGIALKQTLKKPRHFKTAIAAEPYLIIRKLGISVSNSIFVFCTYCHQNTLK